LLNVKLLVHHVTSRL